MAEDKSEGSNLLVFPVDRKPQVPTSPVANSGTPIASTTEFVRSNKQVSPKQPGNNSIIIPELDDLYNEDDIYEFGQPVSAILRSIENGKAQRPEQAAVSLGRYQKRLFTARLDYINLNIPPGPAREGQLEKLAEHTWVCALETNSTDLKNLVLDFLGNTFTPKDVKRIMTRYSSLEYGFGAPHTENTNLPVTESSVSSKTVNRPKLRVVK